MEALAAVAGDKKLTQLIEPEPSYQFANRHRALMKHNAEWNKPKKPKMLPLSSQKADCGNVGIG